MNIEFQVGKQNQKEIEKFRNKVFSSLVAEEKNYKNNVVLSKVLREISIPLNISLKEQTDMILNNSTKNRKKCYKIIP